MNWSANPAEHPPAAPNSVVTTGTARATGRTVPFQQLTVAQLRER
jgi:hypothetical protein